MTNMTLEAIKWNDGKLEILDQLMLPIESRYIHVRDAAHGCEVIHKMQVRGAPAIAIVGCLSVASELLSMDLNKVEDCYELHKFISNKVHALISARPTAVNMKLCGENLIKYSSKMLDIVSAVEEYRKRIVDWCVKMLEDDIETNKTLSSFGCERLLKSVSCDTNLTVLTHCNTGSLATAGYGTALGVIRMLHSQKRLERAYCTETRPYNQGARLTAYELVYEKIPATLVCDSMVAALMKTVEIHAVVVGADRVARNGDTANKIGTYQIAVSAKHHGIPFYVCAPCTSIDASLQSGSSIPIEERPAAEMTAIAGNTIAAPGIDCWNPAFDVTPSELITGGIITEKGVFGPSELCVKLGFSDLCS